MHTLLLCLLSIRVYSCIEPNCVLKKNVKEKVRNKPILDIFALKKKKSTYNYSKQKKKNNNNNLVGPLSGPYKNGTNLKWIFIVFKITNAKIIYLIQLM